MSTSEAVPRRKPALLEMMSAVVTMKSTSIASVIGLLAAAAALFTCCLVNGNVLSIDKAYLGRALVDVSPIEIAAADVGLGAADAAAADCVLAPCRAFISLPSSISEGDTPAEDGL